MISLGCVNGIYKESDVGVVTDFQIFGRILSRQEMEDYTGCKNRFYGDIVNWDLEEWVFNKTSTEIGISRKCLLSPFMDSKYTFCWACLWLIINYV